MLIGRVPLIVSVTLPKVLPDILVRCEPRLSPAAPDIERRLLVIKTRRFAPTSWSGFSYARHDDDILDQAREGARRALRRLGQLAICRYSGLESDGSGDVVPRLVERSSAMAAGIATGHFAYCRVDPDLRPSDRRVGAAELRPIMAHAMLRRPSPATTRSSTAPARSSGCTSRARAWRPIPGRCSIASASRAAGAASISAAARAASPIS